MSYHDLPSELRTIAEAVLTQKQLDVFKLSCHGIPSDRIATMLDISEPVARRTLARAQQLIHINTGLHSSA